MLTKHKRIVDEELLQTVRELPCFACLPYVTTPASDPHHLKTRKTGGHDVAENLLPLCRKHHDLVHAKGLSYMAKVFPVVKTWLECAGWTYDEYMRRWYRSDLSRGEVILDGEEDKDHEEGEAHDEGHA